MDSGIPVISGKHLHKHRLTDGDYNFVTEGHAEKLKNSNVFRGDVVFTHAGSIGQVSWIPDNSRYERYVLSQRQFYLRCNRSRANPAWIAYFFRSREGQHKLLANASQTGVPSIARPASYLKTIELSLPPLDQQDEIVHILGTLDDKIELNRRMNRTLETIAQSIFKSWFVDFEPVKAKAAAKAAGASPEEIERAAMTAIAGKTEAELDQLPEPQQQSLAKTAALFPDTFQDSELGEIPERWTPTPFGKLLTLQIGGDWGKKKPDEKHTSQSSIIRGTDIPDLKDSSTNRSPKRWIEPKKLAKRKLEVGDIVIEISGGSPKQPTGRSLRISEEIIDVLGGVVEPASFCRLFRPVDHWTGLFAAVHLDCIYSRGKMWGYPNQSTGIANFQTKRFLKDEVVALPSEVLLKEFHRTARPFVDSNLNRQSRTLAQLRDTLLPKLLSGELGVSAEDSGAREVLA